MPNVRTQSLPVPTATTASSTSLGHTSCWMNSPFTTSCSVLFCQRAAEINDGDLIVVKENGAFALYLYLKDRKIKADGEKRILHNKSKAYAKVLGSFNFYH